MPRTGRVPTELTRRPFSLNEARAAGLPQSSLKGREWRRIGASMYCWSRLAPDHWAIVSAWHRNLPCDAIFVGRTAAWLHGLDLDPTNPIEIAVPLRHELRSRQGANVWRCDIPSTEVTKAREMPTTTVSRTILDLCARRTPLDALIALDGAARRRLLIDHFRRRPGAARLRRLAMLAAPAESPMETRLRWLLLESGLPKPEVQVDVHDSRGRFVARVDLLYRAARLVIEFDGGNHRERLV